VKNAIPDADLRSKPTRWRGSEPAKPNRFLKKSLDKMNPSTARAYNWVAAEQAEGLPGKRETQEGETK
jgi:hypothetical protein